MILCHNCLHKEMIGALFCSECGAQLLFSNGIPTTGVQPNNPSTQELVQAEKAKSQPIPIKDKRTYLTLNILSTGDVLKLGDRSEITLGRVSEGQPIIPDIDLSPFKAYEAGVSRMHASIKIRDDMATITDLGSANGTRINGRQISVQIPHPIRNGDILTLGKFKIQVLFETSVTTGG